MTYPIQKILLLAIMLVKNDFKQEIFVAVMVDVDSAGNFCNVMFERSNLTTYEYKLNITLNLTPVHHVNEAVHQSPQPFEQFCTMDSNCFLVTITITAP